jgi:hypothetical protein
MKTGKHILFWLLLAALAAGEIACAQLAYWTIGEHTSVLILLALAVGNLLPLALAFTGHRRAAAGAALILGLLIIPYQLYLGHRLLSVQKEANFIVSWAEEQKLATGRYPADLSAYPWRNPSAKPFIQDYSLLEPGGEFMLLFCVGTPSTSHWYAPSDGWSYYPD